MPVSVFRCSWIAMAAAGLMLSATSALAQDPAPRPVGAQATPVEDIIVTAPRPNFRVEGGSGARTLNMPPLNVSLSDHVRYDDLELTTSHGANELRARVRQAAHHVCATLRDAYPLQTVASNRCYKEAVQSGLGRANEAMETARDRLRYGSTH